MTFIETPVFTRELSGLLSDNEYRALQSALLFRPEQGPVIPVSGGLRMLRWKTEGGGKRGGVRLIYYWHKMGDAIYLLFVYSKAAQGDLTPTQLKTLRTIVQRELA